MVESRCRWVLWSAYRSFWFLTYQGYHQTKGWRPNMAILDDAGDSFVARRNSSHKHGESTVHVD